MNQKDQKDQKDQIIPSECPGTESEKAGKMSACQGCPNQKICSSGEVKKPDPDIQLIKERLNSKHKIVILSGKGGVGKSSFSTNLALSLSMDEELEIGLLDIDICGPSIPRMLNLNENKLRSNNLGIEPVFLTENLCVMSIGFLLEKEENAIIWRGPKKNGIIKQFLKDVNWGNLDFLIIDTPPGTSDEHLSIVQLLKESGIDGAILITTPQEISLQDVRKEINFCKKVKLPILGVIENMSLFKCPNCNHESKIFPSVKDNSTLNMCKDMNVPFLGSIPIDPRIRKCGDEGKSFLDEWSNTLAANCYQNIVKKILQKF